VIDRFEISVEKERGLQSLSTYREKSDESERETTHPNGVIDLAMQMFRNTPRTALHPEDHPGHKCNSED